MPIPDPDQPTDFAKAMQENLERMRADAAERAKVTQAVKERRLAREEADKEEARRQEEAFVRGIEDIPTREALLEHIRRMRAGPPAPPAPPPLNEAARIRLEQEQEAGRRALAHHQAFAASHGSSENFQEVPRVEKSEAVLRQAQEQDQMEEAVYPTQQQQFSVTRATRGRRK
jgi:hypothetical protein